MGEEELSEAINVYEINPDDEENYIPLLNYFRKEEHGSENDYSKLIKALADAARSEVGRKFLVQQGVVKEIGDRKWEDNQEYLLQICRLGGNVCFEFPEGRTAILSSEILGKLADLMEFKLEQEQFLSSKIWMVLPSFLHNYCHENKSCLQTIRPLSKILISFFSSATLSTSEDILNKVENFVGFLSGLVQHEGKLEFFSDQNLLSGLTHILDVLKSETCILSVLELFQELFENEEICKLYANNDSTTPVLRLTDGVCLIESENDEKVNGISEDVANKSLDVLALMSSHNSVVSIIIDISPPSPLYSSVTTWLSSPPSNHHLTTASLICGNICTSDEACLQLLDTSLPGFLIEKMSTQEESKVQHAVIGCLRNFAVCKDAREQLINLGAVDKSCQMIKTLSEGADHTTSPKLLCFLRLISQAREEESKNIGENNEMIEALVKIGQHSLVPGLNIEATRLLSSLIRYSKSSKVLSLAAEGHVTKLLVGLLASKHPQLINETLVALCLLTAHLPPIPEVVEELDPEFVSNKVFEILEMDNTQCPKEVKMNAVTLTINIMKWKMSGVTEPFKKPNLLETVDALGDKQLLEALQLQLEGES